MILPRWARRLVLAHTCWQVKDEEAATTWAQGGSTEAMPELVQNVLVEIFPDFRGWALIPSPRVLEVGHMQPSRCMNVWPATHGQTIKQNGPSQNPLWHWTMKQLLYCTLLRQGAWTPCASTPAWMLGQTSSCLPASFTTSRKAWIATPDCLSGTARLQAGDTEHGWLINCKSLWPNSADHSGPMCLVAGITACLGEFLWCGVDLRWSKIQQNSIYKVRASIIFRRVSGANQSLVPDAFWIIICPHACLYV